VSWFPPWLWFCAGTVLIFLLFFLLLFTVFSLSLINCLLIVISGRLSDQSFCYSVIACFLHVIVCYYCYCYVFHVSIVWTCVPERFLMKLHYATSIDIDTSYVRLRVHIASTRIWILGFGISSPKLVLYLGIISLWFLSSSNYCSFLFSLRERKVTWDQRRWLWLWPKD
jgi:hypothetical protein